MKYLFITALILLTGCVSLIEKLPHPDPSKSRTVDEQIAWNASPIRARECIFNEDGSKQVERCTDRRGVAPNTVDGWSFVPVPQDKLDALTMPIVYLPKSSVSEVEVECFKRGGGYVSGCSYAQAGQFVVIYTVGDEQIKNHEVWHHPELMGNYH